MVVETEIVDDERSMCLMDMPLNGCASPLDDVFSMSSGSSVHSCFWGEQYDFEV
jgi:hypothetical protein